MTTNTKTTFALNPITGANADALRATGGRMYVADHKPGFPCRQCLRDAEVGEELILVSHDPFTRETPYRSASPIFLHREPCGEPLPSMPVPEQLTVRQLSVRSFDADEMMIRAAVIDGAELAAVITDRFEDPAADQVHVHFAERGCWATNVSRQAT